jgi:hypothetical protein
MTLKKNRSHLNFLTYEDFIFFLSVYRPNILAPQES